MTNEELERQFRSAVGRPTTRAACPAPEQLLAAAEHGAGDAVRLQVLEHVATCLDCRADYEAARALLQSADAPAARLAWRPLALAASVVLAVGLVARWQLRKPEAPVLRGDASQVRLWGADVVDSAVRFAWRPDATGGRYTLEIITDAGDPVFTAATSDTLLTVPLNALRSGPLTWSILLLQPDGTERRSAAQMLSLP